MVEGDTIQHLGDEPLTRKIENSRQPLPLIVKDSTRQEFLAVAPHKSGTYWLNFLSPYFAGFLVDEISGLKWQYPRKIFIQANENDISFTPYIPMDSSLLVRKNKITFNPTALINGYHPAWEFGYERMHGTKRATQFSLSLLRSWDNDYARNSKGFIASVEHKVFLRSEEKTRWFVSLMLEHHRKDHDAFLRFVITDSQGQTVFPRQEFVRLTTIEKRFISLTPRVGFEQYLSPQLVAEGFLGVGLRYRRVRHQDSNPLTRNIFDDDWWIFSEEFSSNREASNFRPTFDLGIRLAWVF